MKRMNESLYRATCFSVVPRYQHGGSFTALLVAMVASIAAGFWLAVVLAGLLAVSK